jgi:CRISPR/Cas system-associated protein Cas7 (RAMP superfamily)
MSRIRITLLALTGLIAIGAQAQAATNGPLTREQVRAEFFKARSEGRLPPSGENGYVPQVSRKPSTVTRAEVIRDLAVNGAAPTGEGSEPNDLALAKSVRTRAEVHAEAVALVRSGARLGGEL